LRSGGNEALTVAKHVRGLPSLCVSGGWVPINRRLPPAAGSARTLLRCRVERAGANSTTPSVSAVREHDRRLAAECVHRR
jgi:hypothetical protein